VNKVIRFFKFLRDYKKENEMPRVANYEITSNCNLKCVHCYWWKSNNSKNDLTSEEWVEVFLDHKSKGVSMAFLTGGEPSLRPEVIDSADRIFTGMAIASNGVKKIAGRINRRLFISIDGPREVHNRIRRADIFDKVLENIRNDKRVIIAPTLSMMNYKYIDELVQIARDSNVEGITFALYTSHSDENDPLLLTGSELEQTIAELHKAWKKNRDIVFMTPYIIELFREKDHRHDCFFRGKNFISFDPVMNEKNPCVLGPGVVCRTCGCNVPMISYALKKADFRAWFMLNRMFPQKYFRSLDRELLQPQN